MADNYQIDLTLEEIFGTGISSIEQTTVSTIPGGANVWTVTLTNGNSYDFTVLNGTAGGDPIPALTGSAMTDTSAVYLYLGSETGYTFGHWYYYDGTWTDGGAYGAKGDKGDDGFSPTASVSKSGTTTTITITDENGTTTAQVEDGVAPEEMIAEKVSDWLDENITEPTGVVIDTSLSVAGAAADSKKVGDELSDLKSQIGSDELTAEGDNIIDAVNLLAESGGGISSNAADLLITILRNGFYQTDQSANITALNTALRKSGATYYSIIFSGENSEYTGVPSVRENKPLTASIACTDGYQFSSVQIMMGGVDVTESAYTASNSRSGSISIAQVTGDVTVTVVTAEWTGDDISSSIVWNEGVWINGNSVSSHSNQAATSPIDVQGYSTLVIYSAKSHGTIGAPNVLGLATESATSGSKINNNEGKQYWNSSGGQYPSSLTFNVETYNYARVGAPKGEYKYIGVKLK